MIPIFFLFAIVFGGAGVGMLVGGIIISDFALAGFSSIFIAVGVGFGVAIGLQFRKISRIRRVVKNGTESIGYFESSSISVTVNNVPYYKIRFSYNDNNGQPHMTRTMKTYTWGEVERLRSMGQFRIKFYNNWAVISEDPRQLSRAAQMSNNPNFNNQAPLPRMETCMYCNSKISANATNCRACGANVT